MGTELTPKNLIAIGCTERALNGGVIMEYYKIVQGERHNGMTLLVRFNEHPWHPVIVYLLVLSSMIQLKHINSVVGFDNLYYALGGKA